MFMPLQLFQSRPSRSGFKWMSLIFAIAFMLASAAAAFAADKIYLKDGTILEGTITREGPGFLYLRVTTGGVETDKLLTMDKILKIERDASATPSGDPPKSDPEKPDPEKPEPANSDPAKDAPAATGPSSSDAGTPATASGAPANSKDKKEKKTPGSLQGKATKVAILNFGPPSSWQNEVGDTVGKEIAAEAFAKVVPMLEKDGVEVVVVRINSGGGALYELERFHNVFNNLYKPRFRTVAWIESAISAAAMSPWVLEEFYFMPEGNMGACTGYSGSLNAMKGASLEMVLIQMEKASAQGKRSPYIMRAMQIQEPLSATIDPETGEVTWFQSLDGEHIVNDPDKILTLTSSQAVKFKFAKGIAGTKEELAKVMGLEEVEWAGQEATDYIDQNLRDCDKSEKNFGLAYQKFLMAYQLADELQDKKDRGAQISIARRYLSEMRRLNNFNPNFALFRGLDNEWFQLREEELKKMATK